jgi:hypothetical protein
MEVLKMSDPRAVAIAKAHVEAWSRHDYDTARGMLADGVQVSALPPIPLSRRPTLREWMPTWRA